MATELRAISHDEVLAFRECTMTTFGVDVDVDPDGTERIRALLPPGQMWAVFDGATIVATAGTFALELGMPGGRTLPFAGLTMVSVRPTHRRRGLATQLVQRHLDDARERGYALSGLWASEGAIYGRHGYGVAAFSDAIEIGNAHALVVAKDRELDAIEWADETRARAVLPDVYARATARRPGVLRRSPLWWRERRFLESPFARRGASRRRHVLAVRGGDVVGYVQYRQREGFAHGMPAGKLEIQELLAIDPRASATLWKFALSADLFPTVSWSIAPVDEPLPWLVNDLHAVSRRRVDSLWLRIADVPAVLTARDYESSGALRFAVGGATYEIEIEAGRATCRPVSRAAQIRMPVQALASLVLGGTPASALAAAGVVEGDPAALVTADRLFASAVAPWCPEVF